MFVYHVRASAVTRVPPRARDFDVDGDPVSSDVDVDGDPERNAGAGRGVHGDAHVGADTDSHRDAHRSRTSGIEAVETDGA